MRQQRQRVFDITINGKDTRREDARGRVALEVQHDLAVETGAYVRVEEKYIGGARASRVEADED